MPRTNPAHHVIRPVSVILLCCCLNGFSTRPAPAAPQPVPPPVATILSDRSLPTNDEAHVRLVSNCLMQAGYSVRSITVAEATRPDTLSPERTGLLVLPQARKLPAILLSSVARYLQSGGNLMALGTPLGSTQLVPSPTGQWVDPARQAEEAALLPPARLLFDFPDNLDLDHWQRAANIPTAPIRREIIEVTDQGRTAGALHVVIDDLTGWDTLMSPEIKSAFPANNTQTVFSARGGPRTRALAVEWDERDGSRWIAVVTLTSHWRRYTLSPAQFLPWNPPAARVGTTFRPANAVKMSVGLAFSHTGAISGRHEYWVARFGTAPTDNAAISTPDNPLSPTDTLAPDYKFYRVHGTVRLHANPAMTSPVFAELPTPTGALFAPHPRPDGAGFAKGRGWRQISLMTAVDSKTGEWRGTPATLRLSEKGGMVASFAIDDGAFYRAPAVQALLTATARRMRAGLFLIEGGAEHYTLFPDQSVRLGARIAQLTPGALTSQVATVRIRIADGAGHIAWQRSWQLPMANQKAAQCEAIWNPPIPWPQSGYRVTTELLASSKVVDSVQHDLNVWTPPAKPDFISIDSAGHFRQKGHPWRIFGVNYMPSSGIAVEDGHYFEYWLDRAPYDPAIVERDLSHIQELGLNEVSVFEYVQAVPAQNLLDFLLRCRRHRLRVNLSLRPVIREYLDRGPAEAVQAAWAGFQQIITAYRLPANDAVFAYDIDWEPEFGNRDSRRKMDPQWSRWVAQRYGDIAAAERAWGFTAQHNPDGTLAGPTDVQVAGRETDATAMVIDYRRFLDEWLVQVYGAMHGLLHSIDPHHAVSFRMSEAGDPTNDQAGSLPYQFEGLGHAVDFLSPEGYGRIGDWERVKPGWFEVAYGHAIAPGKPIVWAEVGSSTWDMPSQGEETEVLAAAGRFYADFIRMARLSGSDGIIWWWYPGGFRVGENSDFGLLNPDGTARPVTRAIQQYGPEFLQASPPLAPDVWLAFNRDRHADGIHGVYTELAERFWEAVARGRRPGLRVGPQ